MTKSGVLMGLVGGAMTVQSVVFLMRGRSQPRSRVITGWVNAAFCWLGIVVGLIFAAVGMGGDW